MTSRDMLSVGIDVGTTTTQLVLSELSVTNQARIAWCRLDIETRRVLYQSEPHLTPLMSEDEVDVERRVRLIRQGTRGRWIRPRSRRGGDHHRRDRAHP